jgi:hypothetical protein
MSFSLVFMIPWHVPPSRHGVEKYWNWVIGGRMTAEFP